VSTIFKYSILKGNRLFQNNLINMAEEITYYYKGGEII